MNAASQQRLPIEVSDEPHFTAMSSDGSYIRLGVAVRNPENEMQRKEGDLRVVKQSDEPLTRGGPTLTQMGVRKRNRGDVGFPSSVRISSFNDTASEDVLPFQRERSFSIESSEEEETGVQMVLEDATASPNRPKERTRTGHPENTGRVDENSAGVAAIANVFSSSLEKLKKMLGLTPNCLNGGTKTIQGECICPKYYKGDLCQEIVCVNNGTRVKVTKHVPAEYVCKCPHPEYISGAHCELVRCMNGGRAMDNGHCRCLDYWYTGQFCQNYTASWGAVLGVPLVCIVIIIICCVVCRLDLCPRKQTRPRRRRRAPAASMISGTHMGRRQHAAAYRDVSNRRGFESALRLQENLLNEENPNPAAGVRPDPSMLSSYVIRLDTIPVFNPRMVGGVNDSELKPIDPPPSYEQVIASSGRNDNTGNNCGIAQRPPEYTPRADQPPPPSFRPPDAPRER